MFYSMSYNSNIDLGNATTKRKYDEAEGNSHQMSQDMFAEDTNASSKWILCTIICCKRVCGTGH